MSTVSHENPTPPQAANTLRDTETKPQADEAFTRSMDYISKLADSVLGGRSEPQALQNYADYAMRNGIPRDRVEALLRAKGIPVSERPVTGAEAQPQFDQEAVLLKASNTERKYTPEQIKQLEKYGRLYGDLLTTFSETPGITRVELMRKLGAYVKENRLAGPNVGRAIAIINRFCQIRDRVKTVRDQFPDDRAFFEHTFGFTPQGNVNVILGSVDIAFHVPNIDDRELTFGKGHRGARTANGFVAGTVRDPSLLGSVIVLEYANTPDTLVHERQHVVNNKLIKMKEEKDLPRQTPDIVAEKIKAGVNPEVAISEYLDSLRNTRLLSAADEIIAFAAGGTRPDQAKQALTQHNTTYGERYRGVSSDFENFFVSKIGEQYRGFIRQKGNEDLGEGYDQTVRDCVDAFQQLRALGYTQEQSVGRLAVIPPQNWKEFVTALAA